MNRLESEVEMPSPDLLFASPSSSSVTVEQLREINQPQERDLNKAALVALGGVKGVAQALGVDLSTGVKQDQLEQLRSQFGKNEIPSAPLESFLSMFIGALSDTTLLILLAAACVSLGIGTWQDPEIGWIEGVAIFIAVFAVSFIAAGNDYTKQLQFRALEGTSAEDQRCSVFRDGSVHRVNPIELVVGDICILQVRTNRDRCVVCKCYCRRPHSPILSSSPSLPWVLSPITVFLNLFFSSTCQLFYLAKKNLDHVFFFPLISVF
jgi:Cation transporter/ATPase, N-terminus